MNSKFCVIFAVLFFCLHQNVSAVDPIEETGKVFAKWQSNGHARLKFSDLPEDCLVIVLEMGSLELLLNVAELSHRHNSMAKIAFKRKYTHRQIMIKDDFQLPAMPKVESSLVGDALQWFGFKVEKKIIEPKPIARAQPAFIENDYITEIRDYEMIEKTFKYFGGVISKLRVRYVKGWLRQTQFLGELISNHSSESLVDVQLDQCDVRSLEFLTKPLVNAKNITFGDSYIYRRNNSLSMDELFPAVERLHLDYCEELDYIDVHMPRLHHLYFNNLLRRPQWHIMRDISIIEHVLVKNAQIRSIDLLIIPQITAENIRTVNSLLPNLEELTLREPEDIEDPIRFENVTKFTVQSFVFPRNLYFPRLRSLQVSYDDELHNFIDQHSDLNSLHLKTDKFVQRNGRLVFVDLHQYTSKLINLNDLSLRMINTLINYENIEICLTSHENLMRFELTVESKEEDITEIWKQIQMRGFNQKWEIFKIHKGILFQRK